MLNVTGPDTPSMFNAVTAADSVGKLGAVPPIVYVPLSGAAKAAVEIPSANNTPAIFFDLMKERMLFSIN
jgi:hypothetical protein